MDTSQREYQCLLILLFVFVELQSHSVSQAGFELTSTLPVFVSHKYWIMGISQHIWFMLLCFKMFLLENPFSLKFPLTSSG